MTVTSNPLPGHLLYLLAGGVGMILATELGSATDFYALGGFILGILTLAVVFEAIARKWGTNWQVSA